MSLPKSPPEAELAEGPSPDDWTGTLRRIACRADELVQQTQRGPGLNRECWLLAEQEVVGCLPVVNAEKAGG